MQETEKIIDKKVIDYINNINLSYNIEKDILYVNGQEVNEYIARVIIAQIKRKCNKEVDIETIKKLSHPNFKIEKIAIEKYQLQFDILVKPLETSLIEINLIN